MLKNHLYLSILARQSKNKILIRIIWKIIDPNNISKLIDLIDIVLPILNIKLANWAVFLSS